MKKIVTALFCLSLFLGGCEPEHLVFGVPLSLWRNYTSSEKAHAIECYNQQKLMEALHKPNIFRFNQIYQS